ncbi:MAG: NAD-dependent epimerase/dehydratase family protein [Candidatus Eremiobacteraeota bacterium]|nr:NAD-dependent epimerase/dehydratase family protein [Candidatus Eremiobacteraeota bacterium]
MRDREFYKEKSVCVLGASGFLGSHLVARLVPLSRKVVAFARGSASPALEALAGSTIVLGDVRSSSDVARAVAGADIVFAFAGRSGAINSVNDAAEDLSVNCGGLINVLDALAGQERPARIVFPGSRLQYGKPSRLPASEDDPLVPLVPYGLHKNFCEAYLQLYARRYNLSFGVARLTNPYGPWPAALYRGYNVLNTMILRAVRDEAIQVYGDGAQIRDYIYVADVVDLVLLLGQPSDNVIVNGGCGVGRSISEVAREIVKIAGSGSVQSVAWPPGTLAVETGDFVADIQRARGLGWEPKTTLRHGLERTIEAARNA